MYVTKSGAVRLQIDEKIPRWKPPHVFVESGVEILSTGLKKEAEIPKGIKLALNENFRIEIDYNPFKLVLLENDNPVVIVNGFEELYYKTDHLVQPIHRKELKDGREILEWGEDGKPVFASPPPEDEVESDKEDDVVSLTGTGNELGVDISFVGSKAMFGIPERTVPLNLPDTKTASDPYRLYNLDVFAYEMNDNMGLYGNVPLLISKASGNSAAGILWNNPSDTFVDLSHEKLSYKGQLKSVRKVKWMSEAGNFDLLIYPGNTLQKVMKQIRDTTGPQLLPPYFSIGHHHCRWNYNDQKDVLGVNQGFEEHNIPMDVLWLDIDHTDGRRYFTFDKLKYPDPLAMYKEIDYYGRKMVNIVDPHIKRDDNYHVHQTATKEGFYLKDHTGKDFDGWCWPGSSSYIDFTHEPARKFWVSLFDTDKYKDTINGVVHIWNDMNEPAVFNTEEVTMPKDCTNVAGVEFREMHNHWGVLFHSSSQAGLLHRDLAEQNIDNDDLVWRNLYYDEKRNKQIGSEVTLQRGFVLSRAFYAGSQRAGAIWTGDNAAEWDHLRITVPMLLSLGMAGISFVGADVGGFFGNPSEELLVRWYQTACLQPFFRAHSHIDTKRREPWLFGRENTDRIRSAIALRYTLLPYFYTNFFIAEETGLPVMRPMFLNFPDDDSILNVEDQWMIGDGLLVAPVMNEGQTTRTVNFPEGNWFNLLDYKKYEASSQDFAVNMESMFAFVRAGRIIPRKTRLRRATKHMRDDPFTILVVLDEQQKAEGFLYLDDETTYDYSDKNAFCKINFRFDNKVLSTEVDCSNPAVFSPKNTVEKIVILGSKELLTISTAKVVSKSQGQKEVEILRENDDVIVVRQPKSLINEPFSVHF